MAGLVAVVLAGEAVAAEGELSVAEATTAPEAVVEVVDAAAAGSEAVVAGADAPQEPAVTVSTPPAPAPEASTAPPPAGYDAPAEGAPAEPAPLAEDRDRQPVRQSSARRAVAGAGGESPADARSGASPQPLTPSDSEGAAAEAPSPAGDSAAGDPKGADATATAGAGSTADASADAAAERPAVAAAAPAATASEAPSAAVAIVPAPEARPPTVGPPDATVAPSAHVAGDARERVPPPGTPSVSLAQPILPPDAPVAAGLGYTTAATLMSNISYAAGTAPGPTARSSAAGGARAHKPARSHRVAVVHEPPAPFAPPSGNLHAASSATSGGGAAQDIWCALVACLALFAAQELRRHRIRLGISSPAAFTLVSERPG